MVTVGAPISIAQRMGEDTLTYLNRGEVFFFHKIEILNVHCSYATHM